jgi:hypothetical protein
MTAYPLGLCKNPFDWFDSIKVINLPGRTDRLMECREEFKRVGLKKFDIVVPVPDPRPEMSLLLTNLKLIKQAKAQNIEKLLILEDDVQFVGKIEVEDVFNKKGTKIGTKTINRPVVNLLATINDIHYADWKMLYLGATVRHRLQKVYPNTLRLNYGFSNHAIAYHNTVYDPVICILQSYAKQYIKPIDRVYLEFIQPTMEVYLCSPMVAVQRESYSDIEKSYVNYPMQKEFEKCNT